MRFSKLSFTEAVSSRYHVESCALSKDGTKLVACMSDGSVRLYCANTAEGVAGSDSADLYLTLQRIFRLHRDNAWCVAFSEDSSLICSCSSDKTIMVYSTRSLSLESIFSCFHTDTIWCCCFKGIEGESEVIASGSSDCSVLIFEARTGQWLHRLTDYDAAVDTLTFSSSGHELCTGSRDNTVRVWYNIGRGKKPVCQLLCRDGPARVCRFSPHSSSPTLVTSADADHSLCVWDCKSTPAGTWTIQPKCKLSGHCNIVWDCCFIDKEDSALLVSCSGDKTVRWVLLW